MGDSYMANQVNKKYQVIKPKDFITASPYFHSYADAFSEKEKEFALHGDYSSRSRVYTKDFGPIEEKVATPAPIEQVAVEAPPVKKSKKELAREAADCEAARLKEEKKRRMEEAKLLKRQERIKKIRRKRIKREKDHFFVMNKFFSLLMILIMLLIVVVVASSFVAIPFIEPFTAAFKHPDLTPMNERVDEVDPETEEVIPYEEQVEYVGFLDPVFGFLKHLAGIEIGESPFYDAGIAKVEAGMTDPIAPLVLEWYPIAVLVIMVLALLNLFKAFFGMLGRRIFKRFGLNSLIMTIMVAVILFAGFCSTLGEADALDFTQILPFILQLFSAPVDGVGALSVVVGIGSLALLGLALIGLLFSLGIRRKVPYSIFD